MPRSKLMIDWMLYCVLSLHTRQIIKQKQKPKQEKHKLIGDQKDIFGFEMRSIEFCYQIILWLS